MAGSKVRYCVEIDGQTRELFSVRENAQHALTVIRKAPYSLSESGQEFKFERQHFSVHNSLRSSGTTITQKSNYEGLIRSRHAFIADTRDYLLWPVFYEVAGPWDEKWRTLRVKQSDRVEIIATYEPGFTTLIFSIWVCLAGCQLGIEHVPPGTFFYADEFRRYRIYVLGSYLPVPTASRGFSLFFGTSPELDNLGRRKEIASDKIPATSIPMSELPRRHINIVEFLRDNHLSTILADMQHVKIEITDRLRTVLTEGGRVFSAWPLKRHFGQSGFGDAG